METLPKVCPGYNLDEISTNSIYTFQAINGDKNNTSVVFGRDDVKKQIISSFWMDQGTYESEMTMYTSDDPDKKMVVNFQSTIELTWLKLLVLVAIYSVYLVIGVHSVITRDYYCFKHIVYSGQFIHLMSMLAVDLPPPFVYFIQRMSIFGFIEGIFSKAFFIDSFKFMEIDRFYRANYETTSFLSNQSLSIILMTAVLGVIIISEYSWRKKQKTASPDKINSNGFGQRNIPSIDDSDTNPFSKKELIVASKKALFNTFAVMFPYILLNGVIDISNLTFKSNATTFSLFLSIFFTMASFKLSLLICALAIKNYRLVEKASDPEATTYDNLFSNLRVKYMVFTHIIFWSHRTITILIIVVSPYLENYLTIIAGFVVFLAYMSFMCEYRATDNRLEIIYIILCYSPPLITSFMAMLMEGHYISYSSKYACSQIMIVVIMFIYMSIIPFRMYDFYKYQPKQKLKRAAKYRQNKLNTTTNPSNVSVIKDRDVYEPDKTSQANFSMNGNSIHSLTLLNQFR